MTTLTTQDKVDSMLKWGIIFSIIWLAGIGSLISFIIGYKAGNAIKGSNHELVGSGRAWWCLIVGRLGILFWFPIIFIAVRNQ